MEPSMRKVDFILPASFSRNDVARFLQKWLIVDGNITYADDINEALMRANQSNRDVLLAFEEKLECFDLKYFFDESKGVTSRAMTYEINAGQKLYWPQMGESLLPEEFHDGFALKNIFYFASNKKPFLPSVNRLIPIPVHKNSLQSTRKYPALFLDRDGIINEDVGYLHKVADLKIFPDIIPIIKRANQKNVLVIVLTNQSGVARGMFTEEDVKMINLALNEQLKDKGVYLDAFYYSLFFESGKIETFKKKSLLRKPLPGLLMQATFDFPINIHRSFMIGDKPSDQLNMPGLRSLIVKGNYNLSELDSYVGNLKEVHEHLRNELY